MVASRTPDRLRLAREAMVEVWRELASCGEKTGKLAPVTQTVRRLAGIVELILNALDEELDNRRLR